MALSNTDILPVYLSCWCLLYHHSRSVVGHACRELQSFLFVFDDANRIVWEKPEYGHATYFFELEHPLPIPDQVGAKCMLGCLLQHTLRINPCSLQSMLQCMRVSELSSHFLSANDLSPGFA